MFQCFRRVCLLSCAMLPLALPVFAEESDFVTSNAGNMRVLGAAQPQPEQNEDTQDPPEHPAEKSQAKAAIKQHPTPEIPPGWSDPNEVTIGSALGTGGRYGSISAPGLPLGNGGYNYPSGQIGYNPSTNYALQGMELSPDGEVHMEDPKQRAAYEMFVSSLMQYITTQSAAAPVNPVAAPVAGYAGNYPAAFMAPARAASFGQPSAPAPAAGIGVKRSLCGQPANGLAVSGCR